MFTGPLSDLSASLRQQNQVTQLRADLTKAGTELTTGQVADMRDLGGSALGEVFGIDRNRKALDTTLSALQSASNRANATQTALEKIDTLIGTLGTDLRATIDRGDPVTLESRISDTRGILESAVSALNTTFAGQALFSGTATGSRAIVDADTLVDDVTNILAAAPDPQTALVDVDAYFDDPGGPFETSIYGGTLDPQTGPVLSDGSRLDFQVTAADPVIREMLKSLTLIIATGGMAGDAERSSLIDSASGRLAAAQTGITEMRAALGHDEERLEVETDATAAEIAAFDLARNQISGVDPFVAATRFTDIEGQLQSVYTVTARLAGLNLTNFLR